MRRPFIYFLAFLLISTLTCFSQQTEITQFSVVGGYSYLDVPSLRLSQRGFNGDFAQNVRPWLSLGFDFSVLNGYNTILPSDLNSATQARLGQALIAAGVPPAALPTVIAGIGIPGTSSAYTYQAGPQFNYRRFKHVTLFARPALGILHEKYQSVPNSLLIAQLVNGLLGGKLSAADNTVFYGFGGGATWEITPHFGLRATADLARFNFFPNMLNGPRYGVRLSVMPKFGFGKNIMRNE